MEKIKNIFIILLFGGLLFSYIFVIEEHNKLNENNIIFKKHK